MKIIMILGTGILLTFPTPKYSNVDCFSQGYEVLEKIATYSGSGPDQAWILNNSNVEIAGWYCR